MKQYLSNVVSLSQLISSPEKRKIWLFESGILSKAMKTRSGYQRKINWNQSRRIDSSSVGGVKTEEKITLQVKEVDERGGSMRAEKKRASTGAILEESKREE